VSRSRTLVAITIETDEPPTSGQREDMARAMSSWFNDHGEPQDALATSFAAHALGDSDDRPTVHEGYTSPNGAYRHRAAGILDKSTATPRPARGRYAGNAVLWETASGRFVMDWGWKDEARNPRYQLYRADLARDWLARNGYDDRLEVL